MISQSEGPTGPVRLFGSDGTHFVQMGHEGTPTDTILMSVGVMVKHQANRGVCVRFSEAEWLKNRGKVAKTNPEPFCDYRRLWYTPSYKFSAPQGWRHGVHSRSLGHALSSPAMADAHAETTQRFTIIEPRF
jgi:hypothetical protein